jgi:hypothetical protein
MATTRRLTRGARGAPRKRAHGGLREGAGRTTMFPGKYDPGGIPRAKLGVTVTPLAKELLEDVAEALHDHPPVGPKTLSDAVEYCARKTQKVSLDA